MLNTCEISTSNFAYRSLKFRGTRFLGSQHSGPMDSELLKESGTVKEDNLLNFPMEIADRFSLGAAVRVGG